jgi:hypothetical protein
VCRASRTPGPLVVAERCLVMKEWEAHKDVIASMTRIESPEGFITASLDRHVKLWSACGDAWGDITIMGANPVRSWAFPFDWQAVRQQDKRDVLGVMRQIEPNSRLDDALEFEDSLDSQVRVTKRDRRDDIVPKRSLVGSEMADKRRNATKLPSDERPRIEDDDKHPVKRIKNR